MAKQPFFEGIGVPNAHGHLPDALRQHIVRALRLMCGKTVTIKIDEQKKLRSDNQNRFYWGVVIPMLIQFFKDSGNVYDRDDMHFFLRMEVWKWTKFITDPVTKVEKKLPMSSTELTTAEWEEKIEITRAWAAPLGLQIPVPNENLLPEANQYGEGF